MPQFDWRKQAEQGDPEAIALWLNQSFTPRGVTARVIAGDRSLKILLTSAQRIDKQAYTQFIQRRLERLGITAIHTVRIYGQRTGETVPRWAQEFSLIDDEAATELKRTVEVRVVTSETIEGGRSPHSSPHSSPKSPFANATPATAHYSSTERLDQFAAENEDEAMLPQMVSRLTDIPLVVIGTEQRGGRSQRAVPKSPNSPEYAGFYRRPAVAHPRARRRWRSRLINLVGKPFANPSANPSEQGYTNELENRAANRTANAHSNVNLIVKPPRTAIVHVGNQNTSLQQIQQQIQSETTLFWDALKTFEIRSVFPYHEVFNLRLLQNHTVKLLLFLGLFPLLINLISGQSSPVQTTWALGLYYACIWGVLLYNLIRPWQFSWKDTFKCLLFTAFIGIPLLFYIQKVPPFSFLYQAVSRDIGLLRLIGFIGGVGLLEELCKALPLFIFFRRSQRLSDPHTAAFYGAMSGLGFAIAEGFTYSMVYASGLTKLYALGATKGYLGLGSYVAANTIRFVSLPLFHAMLAGIVGYFIGLAAINPSRRRPLYVIGVAIAAILHGFYNAFSGNVVGLFVIAFSILLFITYLKRSKQMVAEMRKAEYQR
jgi:protease PrsW